MGSVMNMRSQSGNRTSGGGVSLKERDEHIIAVASEGTAKGTATGQALKERTAPQKTSSRRGYEFAKRAFDLIGSLVGLVILSPVILVISIMILSERSGKHVFYKQRRIGRYGKEIYIFKFRSMVDNADDVEKWLDENQLKKYYAEFKVDNDPRVTKVGKFLRRTGLDELPQILNIIKGDLSIVGPRPVQESELAFYGKDKDTLLSVRPGLTGFWQVYCTKGQGASYSDGKRQRMELHYINKRSFLGDLKLCFATFGALVRKAKRGQ